MSGRNKTFASVAMGLVCFGVTLPSFAELIYEANISKFEVVFRGVVDVNTLDEASPALLSLEGGAAFTQPPVAEGSGGGSSKTSLSDFGPNLDGIDLSLDLKSLALNDSVFLSPRTDGEAVSGASEASSANSSVMTEGLITIENTTSGASSQNLLAIFELNWRWEVLLREDHPGLDSSEASMGLSVTSNGITFLDIQENFVSPFNDGKFRSEEDSGQFFGVFLSPGAIENIQLRADVSGSSTSLVPEPTTGALLGLIGVSLLSRRRRAA